MGIVCSKIKHFCCKLPIIHSTCIVTFAIVQVFLTSKAGNWFSPFAKTGTSNLAPTKPNILPILESLSAITESPCVNFDKKFKF